MTYNQTPIVQVSRGDLIYGLSRERQKYVIAYAPFRFINMNYNPKDVDYIPTTIDHYLIPFEKFNNERKLAHIEKGAVFEKLVAFEKLASFEKLESFKELASFKELENSEKSAISNLCKERNQTKLNIGSAQRREYNLNLPKKRGFRDNYNAHMIGHKAYYTAMLPEHDKRQLDYEVRKKHFIRKCKGGLSWVVTDSDPIAQKIKVHFILDGLDMRSIVSKQPYVNNKTGEVSKTSITASELRWIYRNRHNPKVKQKIHFWFEGKPTIPPWESEEGKMIWQKYVPKYLSE
ncbi:T3SS effector EspK [Xenorhabdus mauleonii]|uniref:T3SS effector EspK n=1 Tax=Xenorhabdus mauleonii TaxID=351675 RepID=A0A1I3N6B7_9GAMM|nr:hypothetical protein [Xenorhabdus mauleonii]PHM45768.1 T3SS effector EspK [Xenorhabdus mauleonii]SFJ04821.1 hypothetical protein SAMN05421680_105104 [Xenorhabdus mauleonii]